jgi:hypothetical protein
MLARMQLSSSRIEIVAALAWLALGVVAAVLSLRGERPCAYVLAGAVVALVVPDRDRSGWSGFLPAAIARVADTVLFGAIAWSLGRHDGDVAGAAAAASLLSAALLSAYVRVRAISLGIGSGRLVWTATPVERGVRLLLVGIGLLDPLVPMLWAAVAFTLLLTGVRSAGVWRHA